MDPPRSHHGPNMGVNMDPPWRHHGLTTDPSWTLPTETPRTRHGYAMKAPLRAGPTTEEPVADTPSRNHEHATVKPRVNYQYAVVTPWELHGPVMD